MPRIKNKIYKWISSIPHRNMEDKGTEPFRHTLFSDTTFVIRKNS